MEGNVNQVVRNNQLSIKPVDVKPVTRGSFGAGAYIYGIDSCPLTPALDVARNQNDRKPEWPD